MTALKNYLLSFIEFYKKNYLNIILFSSTFFILIFILVTDIYILKKDYQTAKIKIKNEAVAAVNTFEKHTALVINQIEIILNSLLMVYNHTNSLSLTKKYINGLNINKIIIEDIFIADAMGNFLIPDNEETKNKNVLDRDYYKYHLHESNNNIFISSVEKGYLSKQYRFRITRRINNPDGSFHGIIIATINPKSFTNYYEELKIGKQNVTSLIGLNDKKMRARIPEPNEDRWMLLIESPLFKVIENDNFGSFKHLSEIDNIYRTYIYKKVNNIPLAVVVGFSEEDIYNRIKTRKNLLLIASLIPSIFIVSISIILYSLFKTNNKLKSVSLKLKDLSVKDQLTGCFNRRYFDIQIDNEIIRAKRFEHNLSIIMCDIDYFKTINDTYGHIKGDIILQKFTEILLTGIRKNIDYVTRFGGDEFLIVLPQTDLNGAHILAERYRSTIEKQTFTAEYSTLNITASFGIISKKYNKHTKDGFPTDILTYADDMLYKAKSNGRNCIMAKEL